jgi:hypothetical protein
MARLTVLTLSALVIFVGFGLPFMVVGYIGIFFGGLVVLLGVWLLWLCETKTKKSLEEETPLNNFLKADGKNLVERPK